MIADAIIVIAPAVIVLAVVQILLLVRQPGLKQDDPAKLGHPMASPATPAAAHAAILRRT